MDNKSPGIYREPFPAPVSDALSDEELFSEVQRRLHRISVKQPSIDTAAKAFAHALVKSAKDDPLQLQTRNGVMVAMHGLDGTSRGWVDWAYDNQYEIASRVAEMFDPSMFHIEVYGTCIVLRKNTLYAIK